MSVEKYLASLKECIVKLDFGAISEVAKEAIDAGVDPSVAITEGMAAGIATVGEKFESGEYFLSELIVAGEIMKEGLKVINPYLEMGRTKRLGKVVIATVQGDHHDIGKSIVTTLLEAQGFEVIDLGVDVPKDKIIDAMKEHKPAILGLSALLTVTMPEMREIIEALNTASLREEVRVIIGGAPVTSDFGKSIGADHSAVNAWEGVKRCIDWVALQERT